MLKGNRANDGTLISQLRPNSEKRVTLVCDGCQEETTTTYANYLRARKRFRRKKTYCRGCSNRISGVAKRGKPIRKTGARPNVQADKHHSWRGGRRIGSDGYVIVYMAPKTYRKEHFLVMEKKIKRSLRSGEVVHHIDIDKLNNDVSNLVLLRDNSEHQTVHASLRCISTSLVRLGLIYFDRRIKKYKAVGKLRELLEQPGEANQQPSRRGDATEGSTTRRESHADNNRPRARSGGYGRR